MMRSMRSFHRFNSHQSKIQYKSSILGILKADSEQLRIKTKCERFFSTNERAIQIWAHHRSYSNILYILNIYLNLLEETNFNRLLISDRFYSQLFRTNIEIFEYIYYSYSIQNVVFHKINENYPPWPSPIRLKFNMA